MLAEPHAHPDMLDLDVEVHRAFEARPDHPAQKQRLASRAGNEIEVASFSCT
jgi:hypothetical protein